MLCLLHITGFYLKTGVQTSFSSKNRIYNKQLCPGINGKEMLHLLQNIKRWYKDVLLLHAVRPGRDVFPRKLVCVFQYSFLATVPPFHLLLRQCSTYPSIPIPELSDISLIGRILLCKRHLQLPKHLSKSRHNCFQFPHALIQDNVSFFSLPKIKIMP